jgi:hypothetical protein
MAVDPLMTQLVQAEQQLQLLSRSLLQGDALAYETATLSLRNAVAQLALTCHDLPTPVSPAVAERLQLLAQALLRQRDQLARRATVVQRSLSVMLPDAQPTYQAPPGRGGGFGGQAPRLYSSAAR